MTARAYEVLASAQTNELEAELARRGAVAIIWTGDEGEQREELRRPAEAAAPEFAAMREVAS